MSTWFGNSVTKPLQRYAEHKPTDSETNVDDVCRDELDGGLYHLGTTGMTLRTARLDHWSNKSVESDRRATRARDDARTTRSVPKLIDFITRR